jgi:gluconolactonase
MAILDLETQVSYAAGGFGEGLDHPECIAQGVDGYAYAGGERGQIYRIDVKSGEFTEIANTGTGFVGGLAQDGAGNLYACSGGAVARITPGGIVGTYTKGSPAEPIRTPNYPVFDTSGNLYVSDSGEWKKDNGRVFKVQPGGEATVWCAELREFPNGLSLSPDGAFLYVVMSLNAPRIVRVAIEGGSAGDVEKVVDLPGTVPDGIAFDTGGNLYISCYRPDQIYRLSSGGKLEVLAEDPEGTMMAAPTNVAFCGARRELLLSANLGRWHITRYHLDEETVGAPLNYPRLDI